MTSTSKGPPSQPSRAWARNAFTWRISRWHSNALIEGWFVTTRKTRIVRSDEASGCSSSIRLLSAKGLSAGPINPSGSNSSWNCARGEPASICSRNRCNRSRSFSGCKTDIASSNAGGSRFKSRGTAIDCRSRIPSGVCIGEPARTRSAPRLFPQMFRENRRKFFQFIDVVRLTMQRECKLARLLKSAVVNFQSLHRAKFARKHVEHFAIE